MSALPSTLRTLVALSFVAPTIAYATDWTFVPTPAEYTTWPEHCRVQYSWVARGQNDYGNAYPIAEVDLARDAMGARIFSVLHHYCAASIYLNRLRLEANQQERRMLVIKALDDGGFTFQRTEIEDALYPNVAVVMAQAKLANGETEASIAILNKVIAAHPVRTEAYGALATIYRKQNNTAAALDVLKKADVASQEKSAEIKYNMGLLQIDVGQIDAAVESAKKAYELGFPLPGLKNRLQRLGHWPPASTDTAARAQ
jgi:tetratricopeptide (TPR) repeat protein